MGVNINISGFKCFNQLRNGEDFDQNLTEFTPNLVGNVGEKVKIEFDAEFSYDSSAESSEIWIMTLDRIERTTGNFKDDGIRVGDVITFMKNWINRFDPANVEFFADVDAISSDGAVLDFTLRPSSVQTSIGEVTNVGFIVSTGAFAENLHTASLLRFGLIANEEPFNFISKTSAGQQVYYAIEVAIATTKDYISLGKLKDWVSGSSKIFFASGDLFKATYKISHELIINPWFILDFRTNLLNDTVPELLTGDNSLKYSFDLEFRKTLTNIASAKSSVTEDIEGVVGWFGENFNGFNNNYDLISVAYEDDDTADPLDGVGINNNTLVTVVIARKVGPITTDFSASAHISVLPISEVEYQQTETNMIENFLFDSLTLAHPDTSIVGTGIIKSLESSLNAGVLTLTYVITYDTAQKLRLTEEREYMTWIQIEDDTLATGNSDRVAILADLRTYTDANFVADFLNFTTYEFVTHELERGVDNLKTSIADGINEDGIALSTRFSSDVSKDVVINTVRHALIARNLTTGIFFELDNYDVDIGATVTDGDGVQQFTVQVGRGYDLLATDQFNLVELLTKEKIVDNQFYEGYFGQKIRWQDWQSNDNVDTIFFDSSKPNDNLNNRASNYSEKDDYEIFLATIVNVSGNDDLGRNVTGDFIQLGNKIIVNDYDSEPTVAGLIETFDPDTLQSLGGAVLYNGKDTIFKITWTRSDAEFVDYAIHRIEPSLSLGTGIQELSSKLPPPSTNIVVPLSGETLLKVTDNGLTVITECLISGAKVQEGIDYKLSGRLGAGLTIPPSFIYTVTVAASETISLPMFNGDDSLYDFTVNFGDGSGDKSVSAYADTDREHTYTGAGTYDIRITGTFDYIKFADSPNSIVELKAFGTASIGLESFLNCANLATISAFDLPGIFQTSLEKCFQGCPLGTVDATIDTWDVSTVTDMTDVFRDSSGFNQTISAWDTGAVTLMAGMFLDAILFDKDVSPWDVALVTDISGMFNGASAFNNGGVALDWADTSSVTTMSSLFSGASVFNQALTGWDTTAATNMGSMFANAAAFNQDISGFTTTLVTNMSLMFLGATVFNQDISSWNTGAVTTMASMFNNADAFNQDVSPWNVGVVTNMSSMFNSANAFNNGGVALDWANTGAVTNMASLFSGASVFNQSLAGWDTTAVINMASMFTNASAFNQSLSAFTTTLVTNMSLMFLNATVFNQSLAFNTGAVTTMANMFQNAVAFDQDISGFDITSMTTAANMFNGATLSTTNYDALLIGWEAQVEQTNVVFHGGASKFTKSPSAAETARGVLIATSTWTISDGGPTA